MGSKTHKSSPSPPRGSPQKDSPTGSSGNKQQQQQQQTRRTSSANGGGVIRHEHGHVTETDFFEFQPHTVSAGIALFSMLFFLHRWYVSDSDPTSNIKLGIFAALWSFVVFGMLHFPDGIMVRPHPIVWRMWMALLVIYMMIVVFFLFQDYKTTRWIIGLMDPRSIVDEEEKNYADDCRMWTEEKPYLLFETIFDEFLLAHLLGYWGKMVVLRDWKLVMFVSFGFEVVEYSLQHMMPNFRECWWDHVIADIIVCNAGGAFLGWLTLKAVGAKQYEFVSLDEIRSIPGKAKRVASQLVPRSLDEYRWEMFDSFKRFLQIMFLLCLILMGELNAFLTKLMWNLPPTHPFVLFRLCTFAFSSMSGIREFYEFISTGQSSPSRVGPMAWLIMCTFSLEMLWVTKMTRESGHHYFKRRAPAHVGMAWSVALPLFFVWVVAYFSTKSYRQKRTFGAWMWRGIVTSLLYIVLLIIAAMCFIATPGNEVYQQMFDTQAHKLGLWDMVQVEGF